MTLYEVEVFWQIINILGIKIWYWMQMNSNCILREMKRWNYRLLS
ncbi:DUF6768 family protein [Fulvivirga marina]